MARPRLRWIEDRVPGVPRSRPLWRAYLGDLYFAHVGQREDGSIYWDATNAVVSRRGRRLAIGDDRGPKTIAAARRAVNGVWRRWADRAGIH